MDNFPARRISFKRVSDKTTFPLKFCRTRWVESSTACYRAIEIMDDIKTYVCDKHTKLPNTPSVKNVKRNIDDVLLKPKLSFFAIIASTLEVFLKKFQSDAPLAPFLYKKFGFIG
ncbi:hypothetical protein NQ314_009459 [Rhamnusium bicolor]|uniref:Uncharacterized protein n=1 Tax=Rhamnusium bicolor TaxID=1586634 RepID=A0AAV8Y1K0_9CUCU|nr:hypothetical protein NQ314_009459 [Rhamnusium bicolor]